MKSTNLYKTHKIKKTTIISKILISITITITIWRPIVYANVQKKGGGQCIVSGGGCYGTKKKFSVVF